MNEKRLISSTLFSFTKTFTAAKIVRIWSFSGPHFSAFGLITDQKNYEYGHIFTKCFIKLTIKSVTNCNFKLQSYLESRVTNWLMSQKDKMINLKKSYGWISLVCSKLWKHWDYKTCRICILTRISTCVISLSYLLKKDWHLNISLCHIRPIITTLFHLNIKSLYNYLTHFMSLY